MSGNNLTDQGSKMAHSENDIAEAVVMIASSQPNGFASFDVLRAEIPKTLNLDAIDTKPSQTRPNEQMWEQLLRNIKSHSEAEGNFIYEGYLEHVKGAGYRVTELGRAHFS